MAKPILSQHVSEITDSEDELLKETSPLLPAPAEAKSNDLDREADHVDPKAYYLLPALAIGVFLGAADQTIVISSYGQIGTELNALDKTPWLATA